VQPVLSELEMGRMSDYDIRPNPKVWAGSPNQCLFLMSLYGPFMN